MEGGDIVGVLHFYCPPEDGSEPHFKVTDPSGAGKKNYSHNPVPVTICDIRGREREFELSRHSFATVSNLDVEELDFASREEIEGRYSTIVQRLILQSVPGAQKVVIFDMSHRKASPHELLSRPVRKVHIDQSPAGVQKRIERYLQAQEVAEILADRLRVRLIIVWKPLNGKVLDHPLVFADFSSIMDEDLVKVKHIHPDYEGETFAVRHNAQQSFWYWSQMLETEALLLQCYDSRKGLDALGLPRDIRCAYASFCLSELEGHKRESIEVRCLVLG